MSVVLALVLFVQTPLERPPVSALFGWSVDDAGDVDGDGVHDIVVGEPALYGRPRDRQARRFGRAHVFSGADGSHLSMLPSGGERGFGSTVRGVGDVDGDGRADVVVATGDGCARVYGGGVVELFELRDEEATLGTAVDGGLDVDGDGVPDLVAGGWVRNGEGHVVAEHLVVFSGRDGRVVGRRIGRMRAEDEPAWLGLGDRFGFSVALLHDLDGDGRAEIAVGAPNRPMGKLGHGAVYVYAGCGLELLFELFPRDDLGAFSTSTWYGIPPAGHGGRFGWCVRDGGDVDADGVGDILVGAVDRGVYVHSGRDGRYLFKVFQRRHDRRYILGFADSVAALGDVDGDGRDDLAIGCKEGLDRDDAYYWTVVSGHGSDMESRDTDGKHVKVGTVEDLDGDGARELLLGFPELDLVEVRSGKDRERLFVLRPPDAPDVGAKPPR